MARYTDQVNQNEINIKKKLCTRNEVEEDQKKKRRTKLYATNTQKRTERASSESKIIEIRLNCAGVWIKSKLLRISLPRSFSYLPNSLVSFFLFRFCLKFWPAVRSYFIFLVSPWCSRAMGLMIKKGLKKQHLDIGAHEIKSIKKM